MSRTARIVPLFALAAALAAPIGLSAATPSPVLPRVAGPIDESSRVVLHGNVHPLARAEFDRGAVEESFPAQRLLLLLKRSDAQEIALRDFIQAQHTPGSPEFHKWLKPDEFGRLYGPANSDIAAVTAWLQSHGFTVDRVHPGRMGIEFSGTAAQLREAFHTEIHRFEINGEAHFANDRDPEIPAALAPVVTGLAPMNNFHARPNIKVLGRATFDPKTHVSKPNWTYPDGGGSWNLVVAPGDFAVQYDINPVYKSGVTGAGQSIAIISASNIDLGLVANYQKLFGLPANLPEVVVDGSDPGLNGAAVEAYLDVELSGSVAPAAKVILYTSDGSALTDGLSLAAARAVGDDLAGTISTSYGNCEADLGQGGNAFWNQTWQQAAAQGQTAFVSAGDGGSAGCDDFDTQSIAYSGLAVNGIGSTPYNVSVGGTDFYYSGVNTSSSAAYSQVATYWSGTTGTTVGTTSPAVSLLKPAPEQVWNDMFGYNLDDNTYPPNPADGQYGENIIAGSGGVSSAALYPNGPKQPGFGYPKPTWQAGPGVPADKLRDLPDVSLYASNDANWSYYPICSNAGDCVNINSTANGGAPWITGVGGTSASSPAMAGIQALINQSQKGWQGQADYFYYPIAKLWPDAFNDVTVGGNEVPCASGTPNCTLSSSGITKGYYVEKAYAAGAGYDLASGLGSVDVNNLIFWWPQLTMTTTTTTLSLSPTTFVHGKESAISSVVAPKSGSGVPTGFVSLTSNDGVSHYAGIDDIKLNVNGKIVGVPVDNLPGGTYQLTARYGGDGKFAPSTSTPVTITVTPEANSLSTTGWAWNPYDLYIYPLSPGITVPYGAQIFLDAEPISSNAVQVNFATPATGTVAFTDKVATTTQTSTQPLDTFGLAEWETGIFAVGSHKVAESYSGDASYKPSTAASAASFTVIPGSTYMTGGPLTSNAAAGGSVAVDVELFTGYQPLLGVMPTGNVTITLGGLSKTVPWQAFGRTGDSYLEALVNFTGVPAGILPVTASYAGDANWQGTSANFGTVIALSTQLAPKVVLTSTATSVTPGQVFNMTATVTGPTGKPVPTGSVIFFTDDESVQRRVALVAGKATTSFAGSFASNGSNIVAAYYQGDANYTTATSNPIDIAVARVGFSLTTLNAEVSIAPGKSGTSTLVLAAFNGFSQAITLTATAPSGITATPAPLPVIVSGVIDDALNITVASTTKPGTYPVVVTAYTVGKKFEHTALILVSVP